MRWSVNSKLLRRAVSLAAIAAALLILPAGCGGYPEVSAEALELAKAVDNLCNLQEPTQIESARETIRSEHSAGNISDIEQTFLLDILDTADAGDWDAAQQESRRLLEDQQQW